MYLLLGAVGLVALMRPMFRSARRPAPESGGNLSADAGVSATDAVPDAIQAAFVTATTQFGEQQRSGKTFPNHTLLTAYSLYKQATEGDTPSFASAPAFDVRAASKLRYWQGVRGTPRAEAMRQYAQLVEQGARPPAAGDAQPTAGGPDDEPSTLELDELDEAMQGMAGPVGSQMAVDEEEDLAHHAEAERWPLHEAGRCGDASLCARLVARGAALDGGDDDEDTALHWACDAGHFETAERLLSLGASPNVQNAEGSTPLHNACACGHVRVAELLLARGASPDAEDEEGRTPLQGAAPEAREDLTALLCP